jgi:hypothetical protein
MPALDTVIIDATFIDFEINSHLSLVGAMRALDRLRPVWDEQGVRSAPHPRYCLSYTFRLNWPAGFRDESFALRISHKRGRPIIGRRPDWLPFHRPSHTSRACRTSSNTIR